MQLVNIEMILGSFKDAFSTSEVRGVWKEGKFINYELRAICKVVAYITLLSKQSFVREDYKREHLQVV
jgi:hypothetical protein